MKGLKLLLVLLFSSHLILAQESTKVKEVGFTTANFNDFGLTYRFGSEKSLWRINAISSGFGQRTQIDDSRSSTWSSLGFGFQFGNEWRNSISQKFELRYGLDLALGYSRSTNENFDFSTPNQVTKYQSNSLSAGVKAILGFNFVFVDNFLVGAEFLPDITYSKGVTEIHDPGVQEPRKNESESIYFGFNTDAIRLSLLYRF